MRRSHSQCDARYRATACGPGRARIRRTAAPSDGGPWLVPSGENSRPMSPRMPRGRRALMGSAIGGPDLRAASYRAADAGIRIAPRMRINRPGIRANFAGLVTFSELDVALGPEDLEGVDV